MNLPKTCSITANNKSIFTRNLFTLRTLTLALTTSLVIACAPIQTKNLDSVNFVIPQKPGGGWDTVARGAGTTLSELGLSEQVTYENIPGQRTNKAYQHLLQQSDQDRNLFAHSASIVALSMVLPDYSYKNLSPVAAVAGDYFAWFVAADSPIQSMNDLLAIVDDPNQKLILSGGGGAQAKILFSTILLQNGRSLDGMEYLVLKGAKTMPDQLAAGDAHVASFGLSIGLPMVKAGKLRVIGYTAAQPVASLAGMRTLREQGLDFDYINYRLFMAGPNLSPERSKNYDETFSAMVKTPQWQSVLSDKGWADVYLSGNELESTLEDLETLLSPAVKALFPDSTK